MSGIYSKCPLNIPALSIPWTTMRDFWIENILSGNPGGDEVKKLFIIDKYIFY
jgi:hypothetical protein